MLPFHGKLQHVQNANLMLECEECGMWRLIYAKTKLTKAQSDNLQAALGEGGGCHFHVVHLFKNLSYLLS